MLLSSSGEFLKGFLFFLKKIQPPFAPFVHPKLHLAAAVSSAVRRGIFVAAQTKINFSPGGAASSVRTATVMSLLPPSPPATARQDGAWFVGGWRSYKYVSPTGFAMQRQKELRRGDGEINEPNFLRLLRAGGLPVVTALFLLAPAYWRG